MKQTFILMVGVQKHPPPILPGNVKMVALGKSRITPKKRSERIDGN
jgi:hypothetical protein